MYTHTFRAAVSADKLKNFNAIDLNLNLRCNDLERISYSTDANAPFPRSIRSEHINARLPDFYSQ